KRIVHVGDQSFNWCKRSDMSKLSKSDSADFRMSAYDPTDAPIEEFPDSDEFWKAEKPHSIKSVQTLIDHFPDLFSEKLGTCKYIRIPIETKKDVPPIKCAMRFYPKWKQAVIEEVVDTLTKKGVIKESFSPWRAWPLIIVKPDGGGFRCCIDYRK